MNTFNDFCKLKIDEQSLDYSMGYDDEETYPAINQQPSIPQPSFPQRSISVHPSNFENQLIHYILSSGFPLSTLAINSDTSREQLSRFVNGRAGLNSRTIGRIIDYFGLALTKR